MRTFDIALSHLKGVIDFTKMDIYANGEILDEQNKLAGIDFKPIQRKYLEDRRHNEIFNEHYRSTVFFSAICHLSDLAHNRPSCFDVACSITEINRHILDSKFEVFMNTVYPKYMVSEWNKYCDSIEVKPFYIKSEELNITLFMTAYEYIVAELETV